MKLNTKNMKRFKKQTFITNVNLIAIGLSFMKLISLVY